MVMQAAAAQVLISRSSAQLGLMLLCLWHEHAMRDDCCRLLLRVCAEGIQFLTDAPKGIRGSGGAVARVAAGWGMVRCCSALPCCADRSQGLANGPLTLQFSCNHVDQGTSRCCQVVIWQR